MDLYQILKNSLKKKASDVHLKAGITPMIRVHGELMPLDESIPRMSGDMIDELLEPYLTPEQKESFEKKKDYDLSLGLTGLGRFRLCLSLQRGTTRVVIRSIPQNVPSLDDLNLPNVIKKITQFERGLILVTGITGSGKSSTVASMIQHINTLKNRHIITIEDPIEFLIRDKNSIITQREIGTDTNYFAAALRAALRQDPDIIFIGEMRDKETIETAIMAAETGHLVLSTLHTMDATETINRILMYFEPYQQLQMRTQLASVLKAVVSQRLAKKTDQSGFVPAVEVMINNKRIRDMIVKPERTSEIITAINEGYTTYGMQSFDSSLLHFLKSKQITLEEALRLSTRPEDLKIRYSGIQKGHTDNEASKVVSLSDRPPVPSQEAEVELELTQTQLNKMIKEDTMFGLLKRKKKK